MGLHSRGLIALMGADADVDPDDPPTSTIRNPDGSVTYSYKDGTSMTVDAPVVQNAPSMTNAAVVKVVQTELNKLGVATPPLVVDGKVGKLTTAAISKFQAIKGLSPTGFMDLKTTQALDAAVAAASAPPLPTYDSQVGWAQHTLVTLGYGPLTENGIASDPATKAALTRYQAQRGLPATGILDQVTVGALQIDLGKKIDPKMVVTPVVPVPPAPTRPVATGPTPYVPPTYTAPKATPSPSPTVFTPIAAPNATPAGVSIPSGLPSWATWALVGVGGLLAIAAFSGGKSGGGAHHRHAKSKGPAALPPTPAAVPAHA